MVELTEAEVPPSAAELLLSINELFASSKYRPPVLPRAATELLALANDGNTPVARIVELLQTDAMLAARVVSRANSAVFAGPMPARTLREAVSRLGLVTLRDIVVEAAMGMRVFRAAGYQGTMERARQHASTTAEIARIVCRYSTVDGELAFLGGLLHDIGIAGVLIAMSERPRAEQPEQWLLDYVLPKVHVDAGEKMAKLWQLPPELWIVARHHHELDVAARIHPLCAVVAVAEFEAEKLGAGLAPIEASSAGAASQARAAIGMDERKVALLRADIEKVVERPATAPAAGAPAAAQHAAPAAASGARARPPGPAPRSGR